MKRVAAHVRANVIAYLALFVALGGTSYAAISIPRNSVGTRQLRNGAVTGAKLAKGAVTARKLAKGTVGPVNLSSAIPGYIAFWARISPAGQVLGSSARATTSGWSTDLGAITFAGALSNCFPLATVSVGGEYVTMSSGVVGGNTVLEASMPSPEGINVVDICP